jgi:hypothetical protein
MEHLAARKWRIRLSISFRGNREGPMKLTKACCGTGLLLSGCSSNAPLEIGGLPSEVGNGVGSQFGNYEMRPAGETRDATGNRCVTFN